MTAEQQRWHVDLHHDDVNRFPGVAFVLRQVCGIDKRTGVALADEAQRHGTARVLSCEERQEAERLVAEIQLLGVRATVGVGADPPRLV
ncbi:ATP-dependent Clp protease adaptor ClpS [Saccharomonospora xinjiangensis]|uniref:ATP-dependent Clp protease adaptor protein ClpS n=1 Tax=Saccharomonospora xinjiangensis XJ-54 TaxID=882086 RepID=I0V5P1_9PSEU|nr:ATP-dependent Clp protease adaptor ClpS [Saccharomonospora xinjiangensis]EID55444.1 ATP-dependent Clp protease adaptor protein ClpS [Saccharomonospora xinjiangensis XJ-54]